MQAVGICCGASTITLVNIEKNGSGIKVGEILSKSHEGNPKAVITDLLNTVTDNNPKSIAVTGRRFKNYLNLSSISEPLAVEYALSHVNGTGKPYNAIISSGGETFIVYKLDDRGKISKVFTGNKCASGTGEFFLQQTRRMNVSLEDAVRYAETEEPHHVSGRCSVFCKSDCTHATNIGVPKGQVVAGLCKMMAEKVLELLKNIPKENIMMIGGATRNKVMLDYIGMEIDSLTIPKEAAYFEALGAALWALDNDTISNGDPENLFINLDSQFDYHPALQQYESQVTFKEMDRGQAVDGDVCILGLDVGSTTTKAILLRESDLKIIAGEYLRTNGDPVGASRLCYQALLDQLKGTRVEIRGLGVTGSGRKIAGLHALTEGVINEIIAHATAALHFDSDVDTIFEIGGQDAKYTYVTNGVASDYAMNEACSAGTGSFLEESAKETLNIEMEDIAGWAMKGENPPNFNDQCAAFISSDIKNTLHEGIPKSDIVAGLVYSICMNYINRVKGARPVGRKVFMQGGVCYNRAVPIAMAALSGKEIIVPPEPGLMGSYGVALEVKNRIHQGLMEEQAFDLEELVKRNVEYKTPFNCAGGKEHCDIGCEINRIIIEEKIYPFGGACNKYYNEMHKIKVDVDAHDLINIRHRMVFKDFAPDLNKLPEDAPTVGIIPSFQSNTYYPLYANFFANLGIRPVLADHVDSEGIDKCSAPFCFPVEIAHGYFHNILNKKTDYVFLPHVRGIKVENGYPHAKLCPLLQAESYYLSSTFEEQLEDGPILINPVIDFQKDDQQQEIDFVKLASEIGANKKKAGQAFRDAKKIQDNMVSKMKAIGEQVIRDIESDPERIGIILFGRPYNAFTPDANKGIPHKFASRGITVIPVDFLELGEYPVKEHMYWSYGQTNLKGAVRIKEHPQLFGTYITNFSCGPDSFIIGYFRDILGRKPSLTLELDNHTADAGLETRIEAFLDIVARYRKVQADECAEKSEIYTPARTRMEENKLSIITSEGEELSIKDPRVRVVMASMGQYATGAMDAVLSGMGVHPVALPQMGEDELKLGRGNTMCKECLPLLLTTGALVKYLRNDRPDDEVTVYFMPTAEGPCRFGQYKDYMTDFVKKRRIKNVAFLSPSSRDSYAGLGSEFIKAGWRGVLVADIFEDIHHAMLINAVDRDSAFEELARIWEYVLEKMKGSESDLYSGLEKAAGELAEIPMKGPVDQLPHALIVGEIYVRKEGLSRRWLPERLAEQGIVSHVAPVHEWLYYLDWLIANRLSDKVHTTFERMKNALKVSFMRRIEKKIKAIMAQSGWYISRIVDIDHVIQAGGHYISPQLTGEAVLTVGGPLAEVGNEFCGAIAIGPFGCMPNRISESILNLKMDRDNIIKFRTDDLTDKVTHEVGNLPFLAIESDGSPFPQLIEARLETFVVQALRLHDVMQKHKG